MPVSVPNHDDDDDLIRQAVKLKLHILSLNIRNSLLRGEIKSLEQLLTERTKAKVFSPVWT